MSGDSLVLELEVYHVIATPLVLCIVPLVYLLTTRDDPVLRTVKECVGFIAIFGSIYWYTLDPATKKAIKLAALSADIKLTEEGLVYKPFSTIPVILVISSREGKPSIGVRVKGGADLLPGT